MSREGRRTNDCGWGLAQGVNWRRLAFAQTDDHPVVCVSWRDAVAFCNWLSEREGLAYRLPTEAQWEYAARAGSTTESCWGDDYDGIIDRAYVPFGWRVFDKPTAPVGLFTPNAFGLHDVVGNCWEWCEDWFAEDYYARSPSVDPTGPDTGSTRVLRGGFSQRNMPARAVFFALASREDHPPHASSVFNGLRVVAEIP